jgi:hypothetical protein
MLASPCYDFGTAEQLETMDTKRYAGPLRVAAGEAR